MHLRRVEIVGFRSLSALDWDLRRSHIGEGWHVFLGPNGSGKSSFLRAVALALVGPKEALALRQVWAEYVRHGTKRAAVNLAIEEHRPFDRTANGGRSIKNIFVPAALEIVAAQEGSPELQPKAASVLDLRGRAIDPSRYVWGGGGWFSAGYGPFRRFAGSDKDMERLYLSNPTLARHLTLFGEQVALTECIQWLKELHTESLEARAAKKADPSGQLLEKLVAFVNQNGFLRHGTRLKSVSSKGVHFIDGNGVVVDVESLSDGFRSMLSFTFELLRQLVRSYGGAVVFDDSTPPRVVVPGVVLIDEVDAHLHPGWQREIGFFLTRMFPRLQFIVTTHSPLVCHAAVRGSIFRLATPGTDEVSAMVTGEEYDHLVYGNVLDAYNTESFGVTTGDASQAGKEKRARLAVLNAKELDEGLTPEEVTERDRLRSVVPTARKRAAKSA